MSAGDRTGPTGMGPMTGRGAGLCAGHDAPGYADPWSRMGLGPGMGWRRGRGGRWSGGWGRGRGWRHGYHATGIPFWARYGYAPATAPPVGYAPYSAPSREEEIASLRTQAEWLRETLEAITGRIEELEQEEA